MITAQVISDSISPDGHRLTTFQLRYPKFIHGEFMTHRVFARNASSARAVPTSKLLDEVRSDDLRATPELWQYNKPGMQGAEPITGPDLVYAQEKWRQAAIDAADAAEAMTEAVSPHKQIVNRILEPFIHINVVVTATEYENFFGLRLDSGADPTMRALAEAMWHARAASTPELLTNGEWHLPYITPDERSVGYNHHGGKLEQRAHSEVIKCVSVARCARVSYTSFETGKVSTITEDLKLYDRLVGASPKHLSPAEHQATPDRLVAQDIYIKRTRAQPPDVGVTDFVLYRSTPQWSNEDEHGPFTGWRQLRKMLPGEAVAPLPKAYRVND